MARSSSGDPLYLLESLVAQEIARLSTRREQLADAGDALMVLRARMHHVDFGDEDVGVEWLEADFAASMVSRLADMVDRVDQVTLTTEVGSATDEEVYRRNREKALAGQRQRTIYHEDLLATPEGRRAVDGMKGLGEHRMSSRIGTEFAVFGDDAVITLSRFGQAESRYLMIRNPALIACFAAWFEGVWEYSPVVYVDEDQREKTLIRLLALGHKDELIARHMGIALRTVRRRIAGLMSDYGVTTRFQLGVALAQDDRV
ncbi:hypothetical protein [Janibacter sp. GXQ6167]|uniref:helix-turn-helix transcriptional regulator n=1 Tax=Janibacter sp. GXQ6167 TaxID=3240791 RepID=UPI0035260331